MRSTSSNGPNRIMMVPSYVALERESLDSAWVPALVQGKPEASGLHGALGAIRPIGQDVAENTHR